MIIHVCLIITIVFSIVGFINNYKNKEKTYLYIYSSIFIVSTGLLIYISKINKVKIKVKVKVKTKHLKSIKMIK